MLLKRTGVLAPFTGIYDTTGLFETDLRIAAASSLTFTSPSPSSSASSFLRQLGDLKNLGKATAQQIMNLDNQLDKSTTRVPTANHSPPQSTWKDPMDGPKGEEKKLLEAINDFEDLLVHYLMGLTDEAQEEERQRYQERCQTSIREMMVSVDLLLDTIPGTTNGPKNIRNTSTNTNTNINMFGGTRVTASSSSTGDGNDQDTEGSGDQSSKSNALLDQEEDTRDNLSRWKQMRDMLIAAQKMVDVAFALPLEGTLVCPLMLLYLVVRTLPLSVLTVPFDGCF